MPNLVSYIDASEYYHPDIRRYYDFEEIAVGENDFKLFHFEGNGVRLYLLTDANEIDLAVMRLVEIELHGNKYYQISKSFSVITQKGYGEKLYNLCFNLHKGNLVSDCVNTLPGSYNLWKRILRKNSAIAVRYDSKNNRKFEIDLDDESLIWGVPDNFRDIILETPWEAVIFENEYDDLDYGEDEEFFESSFLDYLSENDKIERTLLSDYIVEALKKKRKIKDRSEILILV